LTTGHPFFKQKEAALQLAAYFCLFCSIYLF
jgi:hypothetical protein